MRVYRRVGRWSQHCMVMCRGLPCTAIDHDVWFIVVAFVASVIERVLAMATTVLFQSYPSHFGRLFRRLMRTKRFGFAFSPGIGRCLGFADQVKAAHRAG